MPEKHRRYFLKDREAKALLHNVSARLKIDLTQIFKNNTNYEVVETEDANIVLINGRPVLIKANGSFYPTLFFNEFCVSAPKAIVDMGAVPHVCNGANVMAPGARQFKGDFCKGDFVLIADEKHDKAIAIGETLYDSREITSIKQGAIIRTVHFVGDRAWNLMKAFTTKPNEGRTAI